MSIKMCLKYGITGEDICSKKFNDNNINPEFEHCRRNNDCIKCLEYITIDSNIAWEVYQLNKAGFITRYSCSGHIEDKYANFYISFKKDYKEILNYFNIIKPKYLELEENYYFYCKDDETKTLGLLTINDLKEYNENFITTGDKAYIIRSKNCIENLEQLSINNKFISLDNPDFLIYHKQVMAELRNLVCKLCI